MVILLFLIIALASILPLAIIYSLMKKVGIKEAWLGLIIMIISLLLLTFVEITSMYAPTLGEQIRLYFHNDGSLVFVLLYIPLLISSLISMIMLLIFTLGYKKKNGN